MHIHVNDVHICISYIYHTSYIYICNCSMDLWKTQYSANKQCSSTLCNFTLGRVLDYNTSLKEYHWPHVGMFFRKLLGKEVEEISFKDNGGKIVRVKIRAAPLLLIGYCVRTFCPEKPPGKHCTGTGWGIIVGLPKYCSAIDSLKHN